MPISESNNFFFSNFMLTSILTYFKKLDFKDIFSEIEKKNLLKCFIISQLQYVQIFSWTQFGRFDGNLSKKQQH